MFNPIALAFGNRESQQIWYNSGMRDELVYEEESYALRGAVFIEIKSVEKIHPKHEAQLVNYLRMTGFRLGLLVNFSAYPKVDIRRRVV